MEPLDFLAAVLPPPSDGYYCVAELSSAKKQHAFFKTLEEAQDQLTVWDEQGLNTYFALASFAQSGSRKAANAVSVRSLFIDIDIGDGIKTYEHIGEAKRAFKNFTYVAGLDNISAPVVVNSGGGIHAYWTFDEAVAIADWLPVAEGFKRICKSYGLKIDMTVTADAARVLRPVGTHNYKYDPIRPVRVLSRGTGSVPFAALKEFVDSEEKKLGPAPQAKPSQTAPAAEPVEGVKPKAAKPTMKMDFGSSVTAFEKIWLKTEQGTGCAQLKYYMEHGQEDGMEPLWRGLLSWSKVCIDADAYNEKLTAVHPYTSERMNQKLAEIKGPYPCVKLESENPGGCDGCPHKGKITNALALGRDVATDNTERVIESNKPQLASEVPEPKIVRPPPPKGFSYGTHGEVYRDKKEKDAEGNEIDSKVMIVRHELFVHDILKDSEGVHHMSIVAVKEGRIDMISIPMSHVTSKDMAVKALAEKNILASWGAGNDKNLFDYVRACAEEVNLRNKVVQIPSQLGWQENGDFVLSERAHTPTGEVRRVPLDGLDNLVNIIKPKGTLAGWRKLWDMLIAKELYEIVGMGAIGFGSPLMRFTGFNGLTFHGGSTESGTGKSLALSACSSIWGHPTNYRVGKSTSPVAMQQRAGLLNCLPLCSDEVTSRSRSDAEWFPTFLFDFSEGKGKERMEASSNKERINTTTWESLAFFTSNTHASDYLTAGRKNSSEGELRRLLEWTPERKLEWTHAETLIIRGINDNYGVAGEVYGHWLAQHADVAEKITHQTWEYLFTNFNATNDERYWVAGCAANVAGCILAGSKYAGIIDLPIEEIIEFYRKLILNARANVKSGKRTAEDILNSFIQEYYGKMVILKKSDGKLLAELGSGQVVDQSLTRSEVMGRVEHDFTPGYLDHIVEEQQMKKYCNTRDFGYSEFKEQLSATHRVTKQKYNMLANTNGPVMRVNALRISRRKADIDDIGADT